MFQTSNFYPAVKVKDESPPHTPLLYCNRLIHVWISLTSFGHFPRLQCRANTKNYTINGQQELRLESRCCCFGEMIQTNEVFYIMVNGWFCWLALAILVSR